MSDFYPTIADVSHHQGAIDWATAKNYLHFTVLRVQDGTSTRDRYLTYNIQQCEGLGIPYYLYGFYRGGGASEAQKMLDRANEVGAPSCLGYVCDLETSGYSINGVIAYAQKLRSAGVKVGLYLAHNLYDEYKAVIPYFDFVWIPRYGSNTGKPQTKPAYPCDLWQFTSVGSVPGINGNVDLNACMAKGLDYFVPSSKPALPDALKGYTDLDSEAWYISALEKAVKAGYIKGYGDGRMGPDDAMTRGQAACVLANFSGATIEEPYSDVTASPYYYKAVEWCKEQGLVSDEIDSYRPNDACTRQEFATMLWRLAGEPEPVGEPTGMTDWRDVADYAKKPMAWCVEQGIVSGYSGKIHPADACTRAQAAAMLVNYEEKEG